MKSSFILLLGIASVTFGSPISNSSVSVPNEIIDTVMQVLHQLTQDQFDPLPLPSVNEDFWGIQVKIHHGYLQGLSTIKRQGQSSLEIVDNYSKLKLSASLALDHLNAGYSAEASFMSLNVSSSATARVSQIQFDLEAEACLLSGCSLQLTEFNITHIGNIDVYINGLGVLGNVLGPLTEDICKEIKDSLYNVIEGPIKNLLAEIIRNQVPDISELYSAFSDLGIALAITTASASTIALAAPYIIKPPDEDYEIEYLESAQCVLYSSTFKSGENPV